MLQHSRSRTQDRLAHSSSTHDQAAWAAVSFLAYLHLTSGSIIVLYRVCSRLRSNDTRLMRLISYRYRRQEPSDHLTQFTQITPNPTAPAAALELLPIRHSHLAAFALELAVVASFWKRHARRQEDARTGTRTAPLNCAPILLRQLQGSIRNRAKRRRCLGHDLAEIPTPIAKSKSTPLEVR